MTEQREQAQAPVFTQDDMREVQEIHNERLAEWNRYSDELRTTINALQRQLSEAQGEVKQLREAFARRHELINERNERIMALEAELDAIRKAWPFDDLDEEIPREGVAAAVKAEMDDYQMVIRNTTEAFCDLSWGAISKPHTDAKHVIAANEEHWGYEIQEAVTEAVEPWKRRLVWKQGLANARRDRIRALESRLEAAERDNARYKAALEDVSRARHSLTAAVARPYEDEDGLRREIRAIRNDITSILRRAAALTASDEQATLVTGEKDE